MTIFFDKTWINSGFCSLDRRQVGLVVAVLDQLHLVVGPRHDLDIEVVDLAHDELMCVHVGVVCRCCC